NGAEQVALAARDAGFEVIYHGIRSHPDQIVAAAIDEDVHLVGLSLLSGAHMAWVPAVVEGVEVPVVVGGIIPDEDATRLQALGVAAIYTPRHFRLDVLVGELVEIIARAHGLPEADGGSVTS
ncbi:MAG: cobalamin-dependent protein, partial [Myxococcota bacterium]|nr:cobalamin-dependent protein [Myxococcota bacterium]